MANELYTAMAKAFPVIEGALKDSNNPHFKSKYADLESVVSAIKPALSANGLFFYQATHEQQGGVCVETVVAHASGESLSFGKLFVPADKQNAQGYGSALTYARRYGLMSAFGVCPEDDDGNAASAVKQAAKQAVKYITPEQVIMLEDKLVEAGVTQEKLCGMVKIKALRDLEESRFAGAMKWISDQVRGG